MAGNFLKDYQKKHKEPEVKEEKKTTGFALVTETEGKKEKTPKDHGKEYYERLQRKRDEVYEKADAAMATVWGDNEAYEKVLENMELFSRDNGTAGKGGINAVLIYASELESPSYFKSFYEWQTLGCRVNKNEKAIDLLFKRNNPQSGKAFTETGKFFDVSQVKVPKGVTIDKSHDYDVDIETIMLAIGDREEVHGEFVDDLDEDHQSLYLPDENKIIIQEGLEEREVLFHFFEELGHKNIYEQATRDKVEYERSPIDEFVAYSAAYVATRRYGFNPRIPEREDFFPEEISTSQEIKNAFSRVFTTAMKVSTFIDKSIDLYQKKEKDLEAVQETKGPEEKGEITHE